MDKAYFFEIAGKIQAESEEEAVDLLWDMLNGKMQFQITRMEEDEE